MSKRVMLNVALVVVLALIGGATFAAVRSTSGSSATTQTIATAKRGIVLQSVTSTGNVEAPTSLSLSFQQSGEVTAIYVTTGQHVVKNQALAQVDDTAADRARSSRRKASLASAQATLAALQRGETDVERASDQTSIDVRGAVGHVGAAGRHRRAATARRTTRPSTSRRSTRRSPR